MFYTPTSYITTHVDIFLSDMHHVVMPKCDIETYVCDTSKVNYAVTSKVNYGCMRLTLNKMS